MPETHGDTGIQTFPRSTKAFDGICSLLSQKAQSPADNLAGMVLGETGSGKTHLIARILDHTKSTRPPVSFAYIHPIEDPEQCYRYLLREVVVNLLHAVDHASRLTQIERLLAAMIRQYLEKGWETRDRGQQKKILTLIDEKPSAAFQVTVKHDRAALIERVIRYLLNELPNLNKLFLRVLFQYRSDETRSAAAEWLKGEVIDTDDAALLGVTVNPNASEASLEQAAQGKLV